MEREANYAAVGAFVLLVTAMAGLFVYWYSQSREHRDYRRYEIYFEGTVSGLARGAPVRYLGVDVGRVVQMRIDPRTASRVEVVADIDPSAPISSRTVAELSLQGITGLLYIDLIEGGVSRRLTDLVASRRYPVIRSARSNFDVFISSLPDLVRVVGDVAERAARMLSDENLTALSGALANINQASARLPATVREVQALTAQLRSAAGEIEATALSAHRLTERGSPELLGALQRIHTIADTLANTSAALDRLVREDGADVRLFTRDGLPELERLLREGRAAAAEFRELSRSLRENPSRLLYQPAQQGLEVPQ